MTRPPLITTVFCTCVLLFVTACNDDQALNTEPTAIKADQDIISEDKVSKPTLLERAKVAASEAKKTVEDSSWDNVAKSSEEIWNKSKQTSQEALSLSIESGKDAWQKSKETSLDVWEKTKETSQELWENGKTSSESLWDKSKENSQQLWEENSQKIDSFFDENEETDAFDKANQAFEADEI